MTPVVGEKYYSTTDKHITCKVQEIRETAVISMIISGKDSGMLITDTREDFFSYWELYS